MSKERAELLQKNAELLNLIRCYKDLDRTSLVELMKQSWPTIFKEITCLKENNILVSDTGYEHIKGKVKEYAIIPDAGYYVGISIGGSQIKLSIIDMNFEVLSKRVFMKMIEEYNIFQLNKYLSYCKEEDRYDYGYVYCNTPDNMIELQTRIDYFLGEILKLDDILRKQDKQVYGIGLAITGAIDNKAKKIVKAYSLPCIKTLPLSYDSLVYEYRLSELKERNINFTIDNIAKAAIVSEKYALYNPNNPNARYSQSKNIGCIYLGSGIGSSLILDNCLYRGTSNVSELGHIDIIEPSWYEADKKDKPDGENESDERDKPDEKCTCGGDNCLEHKIRKNVFGMSMERFKSRTSSELKEDFEDKTKEQENRLKLLAFYIGQAVKILTNILNLDLVVLTGKLTVFETDLLQYLYAEKSNNLIGYANADCSMVTSTYGAVAPSIGAAILSALPDNGDHIEWK